MIFLSSGSAVVEIIAPGQVGRVYGPLARSLGLEYLSTEPHTRKIGSKNHNADVNITNVTGVSDAVKKMLTLTCANFTREGRV